MSGFKAFYPVNPLSFVEPCQLSACRHNWTQRIRPDRQNWPGCGGNPEPDLCRAL